MNSSTQSAKRSGLECALSSRATETHSGSQLAHLPRSRLLSILIWESTVIPTDLLIKTIQQFQKHNTGERDGNSDNHDRDD